jgi:glycosyltransferase involved in cell wall biosynthesis
MRILYLSQYFPPEVGATQTRAYEMAQGLIQAGHQVTMLAEVPNHPSGIIPPEYRGKLYERANLEGIEVIRLWVKTSPVKSFISRMAFYLSYMIMAALAGLFLTTGKYDLIYATSPPLFVGGAALILSYLRRLPLIFEVRDLWPESAIALGELRNPLAIRWATRLEEACYRRATKIVVTTQEMVDYLVKRGLKPGLIHIIRNGANLDLFQFDALARQNLREQLKVVDKFVVIYAGLLGIAQGLEATLQAAKQLETVKNVHFIYIGDGPMRAELHQQSQALGLTNTTFIAAQPRETIPGYLSASDVVLIPLTKKRLIGALPSKMFDAMACQRPVLLSAQGEACDIVRRNEAGLILPPEDPTALAQAIIQLQQQPELCLRFGQNGRAAVIANYSRQAQAKQLVHLLNSTLPNG